LQVFYHQLFLTYAACGLQEVINKKLMIDFEKQNHH